MLSRFFQPRGFEWQECVESRHLLFTDEREPLEWARSTGDGE